MKLHHLGLLSLTTFLSACTTVQVDPRSLGYGYPPSAYNTRPSSNEPAPGSITRVDIAVPESVPIKTRPGTQPTTYKTSTLVPVHTDGSN